MKFRPHFSIRTLVVFVTLAGVVASGWRGTVNASKSSVDIMWRVSNTTTAYVEDSTPLAPFLMVNDECEEDVTDPNMKVITRFRRHHVWLFGLKFKILQSQVSERKWRHDPRFGDHRIEIIQPKPSQD